MMLSSLFFSAAAVFGFAAGYAIPNSDGFPNPSSQQLLDIEKAADGLLPNGPAPKLSAAAITNFQLIAFNENFEVGFFSSLIDNITQGCPDYQPTSDMRISQAELLRVLKTVKAQEELHSLGATTFLKASGASLVPEPCTYKFPTTSLKDAILLAGTFTDVVLGTLQDAEQAFAQNGDDMPARLVASVIGQEGEQDGFYRFISNIMPSAKPFLTTSIGAYAFSALQMFIDTCPFDVKDIPIPIFPPLAVETMPVLPEDQTLKFSATLSDASKVNEGCFVVYLNGQQLPVYEPVQNLQVLGSTVSFEAAFPFSANIMEGLTIAALVTSNSVTNPDDLPSITLAAPGLIQVNDYLG